MSKTTGKWASRLGAATSVGLMAGFGYFATGYFNDPDKDTNPSTADGPSLTEEFRKESLAGSPDLSTITPAPRPFVPATVDLGNGFGLNYFDSSKLYQSAQLINRPIYDTAYENYVSKSPELHTGLLALSEITPLSYEAYEAAVWKETRFKPNQSNSSGAKGYFQLQPDAFYESLYRIQDDFPEISHITGLVERTREKVPNEDSYILGYEPVNETARAELDRLVHDPLIGGLAYFGYVRHFMENFVQRNIPDLEPNQTDLYLISFRGPAGATEFLQNLRNNPDDPAHSMYEGGAAHPVISQNKGVYYDDDNDHWRSYRQVYDYIADDMHIGREAVRFQEHRTAERQASIVSMESGIARNAIPPHSLIFAENLPGSQPTPALLFAGGKNDMRHASLKMD